MLVAAAVLLGIAAAVLTGAQLVAARRSLADAADLTAVSGAAATGGSATRCGTAAEIARANDAALDRCVVGPDGSVQVTATRPVRVPVAALAREAGLASRRLGVSARAGPGGASGAVSGRATGP
ncbi:MAG: hypothetical protein QOG60_767 [Frankiaceae bacterium]|nr:hypothetical protein [Frankiaceae bacterium]